MRFFIVDVFAEAKYQGNQLGVFVVEQPLDAVEMQRIAKELHFSECTFVRPGLRDGGFDVRIFTPDMEVPFAGHPTLGTAFVIRELLHWSDAATITLNLGVGQIPVEFAGDMLTMQQKQPVFGPSIDRASILEILGVNELDERFPIEVVSTGLPAVIVPLTSLDAVQRCRIHHDRYAQFLRDVVKSAILVFTPHDADLRVRVFVDDEGFFEDPATGSANGNLAAWLLKHRYFGRNAIKYRVEQGVEMGRPSLLEIAAREENGVYTIRVGGRVVPIAAGTWDV